MKWTTDQIQARLGTSTNIFFWESPRLGAEQIAMIADAGIRRIEIASDMNQFDHNDPAHVAELADACRQCEVEIVSCHMPDLPWACAWPEVRKGTIREFLALCEATEQLGGSLMVCHFNMDEQTESFIREVLP